MLYDESKHDAAVARRGEIEGQLATVALRMNEEQFGTDAQWTAERHNAYMVQELEHGRLSREIGMLDREIDRWQMLKPKPIVTRRREDSMMSRFLRGGRNGVTAEEWAENETRLNAAGLPLEQNGRTGLAIRNVTTSDDSSGEDAVDQETQPRLVARLLNFGGARRIAQTWSTERGNQIRVPQIDATAQNGVLLGDQASTVGVEVGLPNIGSTLLDAYTYHSSPIRVSNEAIQDIAFDIAMYIENEAVRRLGRITNTHFTTGDGSDKPQGFVPLATTTTTGSKATSITWQELLDIQYDVDDAYLEGGEMGMGGRMAEMGQGMVGYTMSRKMEQLVRKLADSENRPLWIPAITADQPNMIHGYPYELNYAMANPAANAKPLVFGNFHYFVIRSVQTVAVYDFWDSRTAQNNVREILAFCRDDSDAIGPRVSGECPAFAALTMGASD